jgi:hypothetical protein
VAGGPGRSRTPAPDPGFSPLPSQPEKLAIRASGVDRANTPDKAFDGDPKTAWGAGGWPPHWIEADLLKPTRLSRLRLFVGQRPPSETVHEVWVSDQPLGSERAEGKLLHTFRGFTKDGDVLEFEFPVDTTARYVQVRTVVSRSWVAWFDIDIQQASQP